MKRKPSLEELFLFNSKEIRRGKEKVNFMTFKGANIFKLFIQGLYRRFLSSMTKKLIIYKCIVK